MLGYEASRDIEETPFQGVRTSVPADRQLTSEGTVAIAYRHIHWFGRQAESWTYSDTACRTWHDRRPSELVPVRLLPSATP